MAADGAQPAGGARKFVRRVAPYLITAVVMFLILREHSVTEIVAEFSRARAWPLVPIAMCTVLMTLLLVSLADFLVLRKLADDLSYFDVIRGKAASSLLLVLGYAFGHGSYAVWIGRKAGMDAKGAGGAILYIMAGELCAVSTIATISIHVFGGNAPGILATLAPITAGLMVFFIIVGPYGYLTRNIRVFDPWRTIPRQSGLSSIAVRIVQLYVMVFATWIAVTTFGMDVPLLAMATYMPVIMLVGSMPVNVAGFGVVSAAWLLLEPWAPGPKILAFQLLWHFAVAVALAIRGLPFVKTFVRQIDLGKKADATPS